MSIVYGRRHAFIRIGEITALGRSRSTLPGAPLFSNQVFERRHAQSSTLLIKDPKMPSRHHAAKIDVKTGRWRCSVVQSLKTHIAALVCNAISSREDVPAKDSTHKHQQKLRVCPIRSCNPPPPPTTIETSSVYWRYHMVTIDDVNRWWRHVNLPTVPVIDDTRLSFLQIRTQPIVFYIRENTSFGEKTRRSRNHTSQESAFW